TSTDRMELNKLLTKKEIEKKSLVGEAKQLNEKRRTPQENLKLEGLNNSIIYLTGQIDELKFKINNLDQDIGQNVFTKEETDKILENIDRAIRNLHSLSPKAIKDDREQAQTRLDRAKEELNQAKLSLQSKKNDPLLQTGTRGALLRP